jgi:hypothetical protein
MVSVLLTSGVTIVAIVAALGPLFIIAGVRETVTLVGRMVPTGKPDPVTWMICTLG